MIKWLHKLFHPHCEDCRQEEQDNKECFSCITLQRQLELAQYEREKLINALIQKEVPMQQVVKEQSDLKPIATGKVHWRVMQNKLETESRAEAARVRAQLDTEQQKPSITSIPIADIEKEIGLSEEITEDATGTDK